MKCSPAYFVHQIYMQAGRRQAQTEERLDTWRAVEAMPAELRRIAYLLAEGFSDCAIARELGISRDQVVRRRKKMREHLK